MMLKKRLKVYWIINNSSRGHLICEIYATLLPFVCLEGPAKFQLEDVRQALSLCTHLIYGYAHINSDFEIVPGSPNLDTGSGYSYYRLATQLKRSFPDLKVYLSVGGNADPYDEEHKYLVLVRV